MRGLAGSALTALSCLVGRHKSLSTIQHLGSVDHVGCRDCGREFAQYHGARGLVLWSRSVEVEFLLSRGYDSGPAREAWALGEFRQDSTGVALLVDLEAQRRMVAGLHRRLRRCEDAAARALGYPLLCADQLNFPGSTEADGYATGEHVAETLVEELAAALSASEQKCQELVIAPGATTVGAAAAATSLRGATKRARGGS